MDNDPIDQALKILVLIMVLPILLRIVLILIALIPIELFLRSQGMSLGIEFK